MLWTLKPAPPSRNASPPQGSSHPLRTLELFFENTSRTPHPTLLDMGPASSSNIDFFGDQGFKIYVEDFLRDYLDPAQDLSACSDLLDYAPAAFDGILCWDVLDFMTPPDAERLIQRLFDLLKGGGLILALFDARTGPGARQLLRHKIRGVDRVEHEPLRETRAATHHYKNREILQLFNAFEIVKSYYHKNRLREYLFQKLPASLA